MLLISFKTQRSARQTVRTVLHDAGCLRRDGVPELRVPDREDSILVTSTCSTRFCLQKVPRRPFKYLPVILRIDSAGHLYCSGAGLVRSYAVELVFIVAGRIRILFSVLRYVTTLSPYFWTPAWTESGVEYLIMMLWIGNLSVKCAFMTMCKTL